MKTVSALHKMKIVDDNKCYICRDEVDYLEHFFYTCPMVHSFWTKCMEFVHTVTTVRFKLGLKEILFGIKYTDYLQHKKEIVDTVNHVILIGKMCISIHKKTQSKAPLYTLFEQEANIRKINKT